MKILQIIFFLDPDYKKFIESLSKVEEKESLDVEQYLEDLEKEKSAEVVETPLTSYLKDRREEKRVSWRVMSDQVYFQFRYFSSESVMKKEDWIVSEERRKRKRSERSESTRKRREVN